MHHTIDQDVLGPRGEAMADAVGRCVHCGFCLAACPTYRVGGEEAHSPRGRIVLMKEALEGQITAEEARPYVDACLGCLACEPACPSGVPYGELLHPFRDQTRADDGRGWLERALRSIVHRTLPHPRRAYVALLGARLARRLPAFLAPRILRPMLAMADGATPAWPSKSHGVTPAVGKRRARVALLAGCVQRVIAPEIHAATVRVLARHGVEVVVPPAQGCCGALAMHDGDWATARALARRNLDAFPDDVDAVVTHTAGCGSGLREYGQLFAGTADSDAAQRLAARTMDVSQFLDRLDAPEAPDPPGPPATQGIDDKPLRIAYQDACHLAQAQGVRDAPRRLLERLPGVTVVPIGEADLCCGSAGTYNLFQPAMAAELASRKVDHLVASGADLVASGNIGCIVQLRREIARRGLDLEVVHTVEVLDRRLPGTS